MALSVHSAASVVYSAACVLVPTCKSAIRCSSRAFYLFIKALILDAWWRTGWRSSSTNAIRWLCNQEIPASIDDLHFWRQAFFFMISSLLCRGLSNAQDSLDGNIFRGRMHDGENDQAILQGKFRHWRQSSMHHACAQHAPNESLASLYKANCDPFVSAAYN